MSVWPAVSDKVSGMEMGLEMQDRARSLWPQLNGTVNHDLPSTGILQPAPAQQQQPPPPPSGHHNLPAIAALTSCRPSSSPALKAVSVSSLATAPPLDNVFNPPRHPSTPSPSPSAKPPLNNSSCPSPASPRDRREDHVFALPNPPRPLQSTTRAPTPFPESHSPGSHVFHVSTAGLEPRPPSSDHRQSPNACLPPTSPIPFSIPSKSAFATVPRPQPIRPDLPSDFSDNNARERTPPESQPPLSNAPVNAPQPPARPPVKAEEQQPPPGGTNLPLPCQPEPPDAKLCDSILSSQDSGFTKAPDIHSHSDKITPASDSNNTLPVSNFSALPVNPPTNPPDNCIPKSSVGDTNVLTKSDGVFSSSQMMQLSGETVKPKPDVKPTENNSDPQASSKLAPASQFPMQQHIQYPINQSTPTFAHSEFSKQQMGDLPQQPQLSPASGGTKNYSNPNRRYLATSSADSAGFPLSPRTNPHSTQVSGSIPVKDVNSLVRPPAPLPDFSGIAPQHNQFLPRATASTKMPAATHPQANAHSPHNMQNHADALRGPPRSDISFPQSNNQQIPAVTSRPGAAPNSPYHHSQAPYSHRPMLNTPQNPSMSNISEHARNFPSPNDQKRFPAPSQEHYRTPVPSHPNAPHIRGEPPAHYNPHSERFQLNAGPYYRNPNPANINPSPHHQFQPDRTQSHHVANTAESKSHAASSDRVPPGSQYPPIPHSAHAERPLAFHASGNRYSEPQRIVSHQMEKSQYSQAGAFATQSAKMRYPSSSLDNNADRINSYSHPAHAQRSFETHSPSHQISVPTSSSRSDFGSHPTIRQPDPYGDRSRLVPSAPRHDKTYPAHTSLGLNDFARSFQQQGDKSQYGYHPANVPDASGAGAPHNHQPGASVSKYQGMPPQTLPTYTSAGGLTMTPVAQKRPGNAAGAPQHFPREPYPGARAVAGQHNTSPQMQFPSPSPPRLPQSSQYPRPSDPPKPSWNPPSSSPRTNEGPNAFMAKQPLQRPADAIKQVHLPQDLAQLQRSQLNYSQSTPSSHSPRDRAQNYPSVSSLPRAGPPTVVSTASSHSPRLSTQMNQSNASYYSASRAQQIQQAYHQGAMTSSSNQFLPGRSLPSTVSSTSSSSLPRANLPSSAQPSFGSPSHNDPHNAFSGHSPSTGSPHHQRLPGFHDVAKSQPPMPPTVSTQARHHPYDANYQFHQPGVGALPPAQGLSSRHAAVKEPAPRPSYSPYAPSRGHSQDSDTCRNPFELPAPGSMRTNPATSATVIKSNYSNQPIGYDQRPSDPKSTHFPHRLPMETYPGRVDLGSKPCDDKYAVEASRYPAPSARTQQRSVSGSDDRQKPPISARFPPVPQSNFDLQRQIYDRMTGVQKAPPRLLEKRVSVKQEQGHNIEPPSAAAPIRQKRESPLDLSVKTVRQSADSTRDDVDLYAQKHYNAELRIAGAPKIDFNPNFAGPLVQPEAQPLPPVQSIRKFPAPHGMGHIQDSVSPNYNRKRPADEREVILPPKIPKVDTWKMAMDEKIEERLKMARQSRHPAAPLTPLHPPAQSVTPTNPEVSQPPARPYNDPYGIAQRDYRMPVPSKMPERGWSAGVFQPPNSKTADSDRIVQQISQGVIPDTRLLQDHSVVDRIRSSLEEKEARLQALQAATRRSHPLPPFGVLGAEMMCTPPSYPQPPPRGAEPIPIGVEPSKKYIRAANQDPDLDGLAAFLAARIRTKAEMKQMGPSDLYRASDLQGGRPSFPGISPPRSLREARLSQSSQGSRRLISPASEDSASVTSKRPRDPAGIRSSSETSVFDFRESDSEGEMPGLDGLRRPRKTQPRLDVEAAAEAQPEPEPGPAPKEEIVKPDPEWDNACDMFVEQLKTRPIKRSIRKKKPNPKFFANETETPPFLKIKKEDGELNGEAADKNVSDSSDLPKSHVKRETEHLDTGERETPPLPPVLKEESSSGDDDMPGVTVVKEGRVKLITRKQRAPAPSDSEWGSSVDDSSSSDSSSDSEEESEDSAAKKLSRKSRGNSSSDSDSGKKNKSRGRRTRNRTVEESDAESDGSNVQTNKRRRKIVGSDSDDSDAKATGRRTRSRPLSDSDDEVPPKSKGRRVKPRAASESDDATAKKVGKKKGGRVQTRQQARAAPPARMKLRSKKRASAKGPRAGLEDDIVKFKKKLRVPDKLINVKSKKNKEAETNQENTSEKTASNKKLLKKEKSEKKNKKMGKKKKGKEVDAKQKDDEPEAEDGDGFSSVASAADKVSDRETDIEEKKRGKSDMMQKRALRGSVGVRRSNKAVQNSKRHLNKSTRRRKFRSGFDYMRKTKKKPVQRKEGNVTPTLIESKRRERLDGVDISTEVKSWVVNKSAGETLLHRAARQGYADVVLYCLESLRMAASPKDNAGYTPLHEACTRGHVAVAEALLQYGASVSESAPGGVRPLHQAVEHRHLELVRLLLAYGADPQLATYTGQTALSLSHEPVRRLIQLHMADVLGDEAPKWSFDGPASVFDPKWVVDPLSQPPSPAPSTCDVEMEASKAMLPPLYRLAPGEGEIFDPLERWVLLSDVVTYVNAPTSEALLARLPNTRRRDLTDKVFMERAACCNMLAAPTATARRVTLLRYDDAVRQLLDVEVLNISLIDR